MANSREMLETAVRLAQAGRLDEAEQICRQLLHVDPQSADARYLLGDICWHQNKREEAADHYRQVLQMRPGDPHALIQLGVLCRGLGRIPEAIDLLRSAVRVRPDLPVAHHHLGVILVQVGYRDEGEAALRQALAMQPDSADGYVTLGIVLVGRKAWDEAEECFRRALALRPGVAEIYLRLGAVLREQRRREEAVTMLREAVRLQPRWAEAHNQLGTAYYDQGRFPEAEACYAEAVRLEPGLVWAHNNWGNACREQGKLDEALGHFQAALARDPQSAMAHWNRALTWLAQGDYTQGWSEFEWRWQCIQPRQAFAQPAWDGGPVAGKTVLVWIEQGYGDQIQFIRYARLLKGRGARVVVECAAALAPLFATCPGVDEVVIEGAPRPIFDVEVPVLSLPRLFGTTPATVPAQVPYLSAPPARVEQWRARLGSRPAFTVGVAWQGNPRHGWDQLRSFRLAQLAPLAEIEGVRLVSLQTGFGSEQVVDAPFPVTALDDDAGAGGRDFADTAAIVQCLDLVISADTAPAHLAGALARPVWVALAPGADWRWLRDREDNLWYPTVRQFWQRRLGDWDEVFARMAGELRQLVR